MLFVDWPVGTGFSYSKTAKDYTSEDVEGIEFIYKFIRKVRCSMASLKSKYM